MDNSRLPHKSTSGLPVAPSKGPLALRPNALMIGGALLVAGGVGGVVFPHFAVFSVLAAAVGAGCLIARQLVRRSLERTNGLAAPGTDPFLALIKAEEHAVSQTKYIEGVGDLGERAHAQLKQLTERYASLLQILEQKFDPGEITFSRYLGAVQNMIGSLIENFKSLGSTLGSLKSVDARDLETRAASDPSAAARLAQFKAQRAAALQLLEFNEKALAQLDGLAASLNAIKTTGAATQPALEDSLNELKLLAERAKQYSKGP